MVTKPLNFNSRRFLHKPQKNEKGMMNLIVREHVYYYK